MRESTKKTAKAPSSKVTKSAPEARSSKARTAKAVTGTKDAKPAKAKPASKAIAKTASSHTAPAAKPKRTTSPTVATQSNRSAASKASSRTTSSPTAGTRKANRTTAGDQQKGRTILCVSRLKAGRAFMEEAVRLGCRVLVLTEDAALLKDRFPDCVSRIVTVRNLQDWNAVASVVSRLYREERIDRVVPMLEAQVELAARIRQLLGIPGQTPEQARLFRDKLAMRLTALGAGIPVPYFAPALDRERVTGLVESVAPPYMLKLRDGLGSQNVTRIDSRSQLMPAIVSKGPRIDDYLVEQYIPGEVYHVDSVVEGGKIQFSLASRYGLPLFDVIQGGNFMTYTVTRGSQLEAQLLKINAKVIKAFGLQRGVTHIEFIRSSETGELYFLEAANRIPSARIPMVVNEASGVCLYHELAKLEAHDKYHAPKPKDGHAGFITTVSKRGPVKLDGFKEKEIVWRSTDPYQPGLIIRSDDSKRVEKLLREYDKHFATF
ncbi:argininosuccinate lyase [compost metagenome]